MNSDIALYEINQEFESQRLQLQQANQWADQAQGETISLCRDLEMRNRLSGVSCSSVDLLCANLFVKL